MQVTSSAKEPSGRGTARARMSGVEQARRSDDDEEIRAFHNVCSHRGNLVVNNSCGKAERLVCSYHNWTYRNDGELVGVRSALLGFDEDAEICR